MKDLTWAEFEALSPADQVRSMNELVRQWDVNYERALSAEGFLDYQEEARVQGVSIGDLLK